MPEVRYFPLMTAMAEQVAAAMPGTMVTLEPVQPIAEQCPAVVLVLKRSAHTPRQIGIGTAMKQDEVFITVEVQCWQFAAESGEESARLRDDLVSDTVDALRGDLQIGGRVDMLEIRGIDFQWQPGRDGGIHAVALLDVVLRLFA